MTDNALTQTTDQPLTKAHVFHWRDGISFARGKDGAVSITNEGAPFAVIPPNEWASIIMNVSESRDYFNALAFHTGTAMIPSQD